MSCKESRAETDSEQLRLSHWNRWIAGLRIWPQAYNLAKHSSSSSSTVVPPVTRDSRQKSPQLSASASAAPLQTFKFATKMQSERKNEQVPLFFPLRPSGPAAGTSPSLTSKVLLFILRPLGIISWRPCPRVRPRRHATRRARRRSEIFKQSLMLSTASGTNGQKADPASPFKIVRSLSFDRLIVTAAEHRALAVIAAYLRLRVCGRGRGV